MTNGLAENLLRLKTALVAAGWTVMASSDGTTYFPSSDGITVAGAVPGGMRNTLAWFRIRQPAGTAAPVAGVREFVFQSKYDLGVQELRVKYSRTGFVTGSPSATQVPAASDELLWVGGGTDAVPTFVYMDFNQFTKAGYVCVNDAAPYNWYMVSATASPGSPHQGAMSFLCWDHVLGCPWDATKPLESDREPYVWLFCGQTSTFITSESPSSNWTYIDVDGVLTATPTGTAVWTGFSGNLQAPNAGGVTVNPYSGATDVWPVYYGRAVQSSLTYAAEQKPNMKLTERYIKGFSEVLDYDGGNSSQRDRGSLYGTNDRINFGMAWFPWNGDSV